VELQQWNDITAKVFIVSNAPSYAPQPDFKATSTTVHVLIYALSSILKCIITSGSQREDAQKTY